MFTRRFYFAFGVSGLGLDFLAHYAQACLIRCDVVPVIQAMIGFDPRFIDRPIWIGIGLAAHSMFLLALGLLAISGRD